VDVCKRSMIAEKAADMIRRARRDPRATEGRY